MIAQQKEVIRTSRFLFWVNYYTSLFTLLSVSPSVTKFSCILYSKLCFYMNFSAVPYVNFSM